MTSHYFSVFYIFDYFPSPSSRQNCHSQYKKPTLLHTVNSPLFPQKVWRHMWTSPNLFYQRKKCFLWYSAVAIRSNFNDIYINISLFKHSVSFIDRICRHSYYLYNHNTTTTIRSSSYWLNNENKFATTITTKIGFSTICNDLCTIFT